MSGNALQHRGHGDKLSLLWDRAIAALLTHSRIHEAAKAIKVDSDTLRGWLKIPEFAEAYEAARREALDETVSALRLASQDAVRTLQRNMRCGQPAVEVAAAKCILDYLGLKGSDIQGADGRIPVQIQIVYAPKTQVNLDAKEED